MLDQDDGDPRHLVDVPQESHQLRALRGIHTGGRLVQKEELGLGGKGPGDLQLPLDAVRQRARLGILIFQQTDLIQILLAKGIGLLLPLAYMGKAQQRGHRVVLRDTGHADQDVLLRRQFGIDADILEGAGNAQMGDLVRTDTADAPSIKNDLPGCGLHHTRDRVEHRCFSGAVRPDQPQELPFLCLEGYILDSLDAAKKHR